MLKYTQSKDTRHIACSIVSRNTLVFLCSQLLSKGGGQKTSYYFTFPGHGTKDVYPYRSGASAEPPFCFLPIRRSDFTHPTDYNVAIRLNLHCRRSTPSSEINDGLAGSTIISFNSVHLPNKTLARPSTVVTLAGSVKEVIPEEAKQ